MYGGNFDNAKYVFKLLVLNGQLHIRQHL